MTVHSLTDLEQIWIRNGGNPIYAPVAAAFSLAESGGDDQAVSPSNDWGLWQINGGGQAVLNPDANARAAIAKSNNGTNWQWWTTAYAGGVKGVLNGGGYVGSRNPNYLGPSAAFWSHLPAGATLPPGSPAGSGGSAGPGVAGTPGIAGSSAPGGATAPANVGGPVGCQIKLPHTSLGPFGIGGWCLDGPVGVAVMVGGVSVMLIGTVVVLSRFQGTRQLAGAALSAVPGGGVVAMGAKAAGANVGASGGKKTGDRSKSKSGGSSSSSSSSEGLDSADLQALDAQLGSSRPDRAANRRQAQNRNRAARRAQGPRGFADDKPSDFAGGPAPSRRSSSAA